MTLMEAIQNRHAVRAYEEKEIAQDIVLELKKEIGQCNEEASSAIQLITNDDEVFKGLMAHYGGFRGVRNYIALVGNKSDDGILRRTACAEGTAAGTEHLLGGSYL